jgi:glycosyltransferase involved in cell wall biosynthesis
MKINMPRVLLVHKCNGHIFLGDRIRVKSISEFLRKNQFEVIETILPSVTRWGLWKAAPWLLPLHQGAPSILSRKDLLRWLDLNASINDLKIVIRKTNPDIVLAETSLVGWAATHVCEKLSITCIVDCHGLAFAEAKGIGYRNWQYLERLENETFTKCDYLLVVSEKMKNYICHKFKIQPNKIIVIPNGSQIQQHVAKYNFPIKVIYAGIFAYWEKVHDFLDVAKQANNHKFRFYLAGTGPIRRQLLERIEKEKIPINYLGYIPREKIFKVFSSMQIGIAPSTRDLARMVASPIKVFDYLASGLPPITPKIGDWGNIIAQEDCGIALDNDNVENYIEALSTLVQKNVWVTKSKNAIKTIQEKYNWNNILKPLANLISTCNNY